MKKGDKIRFNGAERYLATTEGKEYSIREIRGKGALYTGDNGHSYVWHYTKYPNHFTIVPNEQAPQAPVIHVGDIIEFLGSEECRNRYRDTTVGERYKVHDVTYSDSGEAESVYYLDNASDNVNWNVRFAREWGHFKVHASGQGAKGIYKDDAIHTQPTKIDLESIMDLALDLEDMTWAQDIYNQLQQLEGEHA